MIVTLNKYITESGRLELLVIFTGILEYLSMSIIVRINPYPVLF